MRRAAALLISCLAVGCGKKIEVVLPGDGSSPSPQDGASPAGGDDGAASSNAIDGGTVDVTADSGTANPTDDSGTPQANDALPVIPDAGNPPCVVDPFTMCTDTDEGSNGNNSPAYAVFFKDNMTIGCMSGGGDNVVPFDYGRSGIICPGDPADFYDVTIICCDTRTLNAEIRFHPTTACDPNDVGFAFNSSNPIDCSNPPSGVTCTIDQGDTVIRTSIAPCNVVFEWNFGVIAKNPSLSLKYTYDIHMRLQ